MRYFVVFLSLILVSSAYNIEEEWRNFKEKYDKIYGNRQEDLERFEIFKNNVQSFEEHNALYRQGKVTYTKGINQFTDLSQEELQSIMARPKQSTRRFQKIVHQKIDKERILRDVPDKIDWREQGAVTPVRSKGNCSNGEWAFAAAAAIEGRLQILNGTLVSLSPQSLIDCDEYDQGCTFGFYDTVFLHANRNGIATEEDYPFMQEEGDCKDDVKLLKAVAIEQGDDEEVLWGSVGRYGPVAVELDGFCLFTYQSGILDESCGCTTNMKYEFFSLVVGYDSEDGTDYWILKNSWGADWGEDGYFRLKRNGPNTCGITTMPFYVVLNVT